MKQKSVFNETARIKRLTTKLAFQAMALFPKDKKGKHPKRQFCNLMVVTLHFRISCLRQCRKQSTFPFAAMVERLTAKTKVIRTQNALNELNTVVKSEESEGDYLFTVRMIIFK